MVREKEPLFAELGLSDAPVTVEPTVVPVFEGAGADGLVPDPVSEAGLFLRDDGTWVAGGGGGAPTGATYVTLTTDEGLSAERTLAVGAALSLVDGGANNPVTLDSRAYAYLKVGNPRRAIADYDLALEINPGQAESLYGRGVAKLKKGDRTGSAADITAAKAIKANIDQEFARYGVR